MLGRLLGGIATSILYSAFESWMIYEHHKVGGAREVISLFKKKLFELFFGILRGQKMSQHLLCLLFLFEFDVLFVLERI